MTSVFLSYCHSDEAKAKPIAAALEQCGHQVWWDRHLHGGARYSHEIEAALKRSDAVVVMWSRNSIQSTWVQDEAAEGRDSDRLVPVVLDDSKPPLGFRQYQAIDLADWNGRASASAFKALNAAILAKASRAGPDSHATRVVASPGPSRWAPSRSVIIATVLALLAIAGSLHWLSTRGEAWDSQVRRVELAAFSSLSSQVPQAVPAILREELLAALGTDAIIIARSAEAAGSGEPAAYSVNGSIQKAGDELRFTVHLADASSGDTLWTLTLERPFTGMELAARQVAVAVSQVLRCGLTGAAQHSRRLPDETLSLYLGFCQEFWAGTLGNPQNTTRALHLARRLTQAAPDFSRGWSGLAAIASLAAQDGVENPAAVRSEAIQAAQRAVRLDPGNSEAYRILAELLPPQDYARREALHVKSVTVGRSDCGCEYVAYGYFLSEVGRTGEAVTAFKRAHDMIPLGSAVNVTLVESLLATGREQEARALLPFIYELWPDDPAIRTVLLRSALWTGRHDEATDILTDPKTRLPDQEREALAAVFTALQTKSETAKGAARKLLQGLGLRGSDPAIVIASLAALGADREALALAGRLSERKSWWPSNVLFEPPLARARQSHDFTRIVEQLGLMRYWRETGRRPDFCKPAGGPPLCREV